MKKELSVKRDDDMGQRVFLTFQWVLLPSPPNRALISDNMVSARFEKGF